MTDPLDPTPAPDAPANSTTDTVVIPTDDGVVTVFTSPEEL